MFKEELKNTFALFSTNLVLEGSTESERKEIRIKQNEDMHRKMYVVSAVFIFVQLFFVISDLITGFWAKHAPYSYLNLTAEILITLSSVITVFLLFGMRENKGSERIRTLQLIYYLLLETGFLMYLLSDMLRGLPNIYNVFYNMIVLAIFAIYSFGHVVILTSYISIGTILFLILIPGAYSWEKFQMLPLFLLLFFLCANYFRAGITKRLYTQVKSQELANEMEALSTRDFLTKLPNRTALNRFVNGKLTDSAKRQDVVGLIMIDIDDFKAFNDFHSHLEGDMCLRKVGEVLLGLQNEKFNVFRYGGEEFLVIGLGISENELTSFAASVHRSLNSMAIQRGDNINEQGYVTVSAGCSLAKLNHMGRYNDLIRSADRALYMAKRSGKNCYIYKDDKYTV